MPTPTPTHHVRMDPRFGFSLATPADMAERAKMAQLAASGRHEEVIAALERAAAACREHMDWRRGW